MKIDVEMLEIFLSLPSFGEREMLRKLWKINIIVVNLLPFGGIMEALICGDDDICCKPLNLNH
jgi:hypothetical protein